jgi:hypothetical protein
MSRVKLLLLSLLAALAVVALSAASASATVSFQWFVGGSLLAAGSTEGYTVNNDGKNFDFNTVFDGIKILLLSNLLLVDNGTLNGGSPGTGSEILLFDNVTAEAPTGCTVESLPGPVSGRVATTALTSQIVAGQNGEVLILFAPAPAAGTAFTTLLLLGSGCSLANIPAPVTGSILGLPLPQRTSVVNQNLVFPAVTGLYLLVAGRSGSTPLLAGLLFGGVAANLTGLTLVLLTNGNPYGPF